MVRIGLVVVTGFWYKFKIMNTLTVLSQRCRLLAARRAKMWQGYRHTITLTTHIPNHPAMAHSNDIVTAVLWPSFWGMRLSAGRIISQSIPRKRRWPSFGHRLHDDDGISRETERMTVHHITNNAVQAKVSPRAYVCHCEFAQKTKQEINMVRICTCGAL